jgi:LSD1 subclass zinc finger protein
MKVGLGLSVRPRPRKKGNLPMTDASRPHRLVEVYEVVCWRCRRTIELPASARPYRCFHCGASLVVEW